MAWTMASSPLGAEDVFISPSRPPEQDIFECNPLGTHEHGGEMETVNETYTAACGPASIEERFSIEQWVLDVLEREGMQTLDQLGSLLPSGNWARLFLALDRMSRSGRIALWSNGRGEYLAKVKDPQCRSL